MDPALARALFRVAQEAMTNALRHAQARRIELYARRDDQRVHLEIRDDGIGFDPTTKSGFGLASMRERAELLGADLAIESAPGEGTTVTLVGPLAGSTRQTISQRALDERRGRVDAELLLDPPEVRADGARADAQRARDL